jgi:L-asparagine transporter-like permease
MKSENQEVGEVVLKEIYTYFKYLSFLLIALKLMGYMDDYSWLFVLSPIWLPVLLIVFLIAVMTGIGVRGKISQ